MKNRNNLFNGRSFFVKKNVVEQVINSESLSRHTSQFSGSSGLSVVATNQAQLSLLENLHYVFPIATPTLQFSLCFSGWLHVPP